MLAYTSHLPLASHCLSVLVTQPAVITCDTVGQYEEGQEQRKEERSLPLCVLGDKRHNGSLSFLEFTSFYALMQPDI